MQRSRGAESTMSQPDAPAPRGKRDGSPKGSKGRGECVWGWEEMRQGGDQREGSRGATAGRWSLESRRRER